MTKLFLRVKKYVKKRSSQNATVKRLDAIANTVIVRPMANDAVKNATALIVKTNLEFKCSLMFIFYRFIRK